MAQKSTKYTQCQMDSIVFDVVLKRLAKTETGTTETEKDSRFLNLGQWEESRELMLC